MRRASLAVSAVLLTACIHGTQLKEFRPAHAPDGARLAMRLDGQQAAFTGELFAVDSTGLIVMTTQLIHVRFDRLRTVDVIGLGMPYDVSDGRFEREHIARFALVSRFPQGLEAAMLARLLVALGQDAVREVP